MSSGFWCIEDDIDEKYTLAMYAAAGIATAQITTRPVSLPFTLHL
jgi:hypothetical protein